MINNMSTTSISLIASNITQRGPGKVYQNLLLGLSNMPDYVVSTNHVNADYFGYLQDIGIADRLDSSKTLFGPNLFVLPSDNPALCRRINKMVVPSKWVLDLYRNFHEVDHCKINVWSVGIDTKDWRPTTTPASKDLDCFVYFKNRDKQELQLVVEELDRMKLKYEIISYGSYQESDLYNMCNRAKFAVLLTGTESQGIAYMQILSMNVPCYVLNVNEYKCEGRDLVVEASSVPYFTSECGICSLDFKLLPEFIYLLDSYKPRQYIDKEHGILPSAKKYIELLKK